MSEGRHRSATDQDLLVEINAFAAQALPQIVDMQHAEAQAQHHFLQFDRGFVERLVAIDGVIHWIPLKSPIDAKPRAPSFQKRTPCAVPHRQFLPIP